jgi:hypothetical protein
MMKMEGGDASTYAASVYGGIGQQHPVSDTNHTIAMNKVDCGMKGGDASPLSTPTSLSPAPLNGGNPLRDDDDDDDEEPLQGGGDDPVIPENSENNSNIAGGDSVLADLAVPAVLLVANQAMSKGRRKTSKKSRKNRRYRKKRSARRRR